MGLLDDENYDPLTARRPKPNVRAKGKNFEYRMADLLTKWTGKKFARVPNSGGMKFSKKQDFKGDITADGFPFVVECKNVQSSTPVITYRDGIPKLAFHTKSAMLQAMGDAYNADVPKIPMVLRNVDGKVSLVVPITVIEPELALKQDATILETVTELSKLAKLTAVGPDFTYNGKTTCAYMVLPDFRKLTKQVSYTDFWHVIEAAFQ